MANLTHKGKAKHPDILRREERQKRADEALEKALSYWIDLVHGRYTDATHTERLRASETLADRFGLPKRTDIGLPMRVRVKSVEMRGFVTKDGKLVTPDMPADAPAGPPGPSDG